MLHLSLSLSLITFTIEPSSPETILLKNNAFLILHNLIWSILFSNFIPHFLYRNLFNFFNRKEAFTVEHELKKHLGKPNNRFSVLYTIFTYYSSNTIVITNKYPNAAASFEIFWIKCLHNATMSMLLTTENFWSVTFISFSSIHIEWCLLSVWVVFRLENGALHTWYFMGCSNCG